MKLDPACCRCCRASLEILPRVEAQPWRRPVHGCACRFSPPGDRCSCAWCRSCLAWWPRCARQGCEEPRAFSELCEHHRAAESDRTRKAAARSSEIRKPPRPAHQGEPGRCALCGEHPLPPRRRSWCSDACVLLWAIATSSASAHHHLVQLHGHACWGCGEQEAELEVEHTRPLWSLGPDERAELRWWLPFNLQLLCGRCHKAKTKREAGERARLRRLATGS